MRDDLVYYLLNKPAGYVSTASDPEGRPTVVDLVPATPRVFPVGRLDYDTEGLLLLTNDGDLTHLLTHPSFGVVKTYLAEVEGEPTPATRARAARGRRARRRSHRARTGDGRAAAAVRRPRLELGIHEGRNRQVRRMCEAVGHPVLRLVRTRIGPLRDGSPEAGHVARALTARRRCAALYEAASAGAPATRAESTRRVAGRVART